MSSFLFFSLVLYLLPLSLSLSVSLFSLSCVSRWQQNHSIQRKKKKEEEGLAKKKKRIYPFFMTPNIDRNNTEINGKGPQKEKRHGTQCIYPSNILLYRWKRKEERKKTLSTSKRPILSIPLSLWPCLDSALPCLDFISCICSWPSFFSFVPSLYYAVSWSSVILLSFLCHDTNTLVPLAEHRNAFRPGWTNKNKKKTID